MSGPFLTTGGARIGWTNASWPLAKLEAGPDKLAISVGILGTYSFAPDEVMAVERYVMIPVIGWGIRVRHCKRDCPERVIFWCLGSPDTVLQGIRASGFQPAASRPAAGYQTRGIPIRWSAIIITFAVWNAFFLLGMRGNRFPPLPGPFTVAPLLFLFVLSIGTLKFPLFQRLVLKPGRSVGEIRPLLRLLTFISGFLLVIFSLLLVCGAFNKTPSHP